MVIGFRIKIFSPPILLAGSPHPAPPPVIARSEATRQSKPNNQLEAHPQRHSERSEESHAHHQHHPAIHKTPKRRSLNPPASVC